ncbi:MAG: hypothetical protein HC818_07100 [Synechococcaceae cyanobacterium RM1_1_27]|nr:hypothetical protein [Synechococcaceae cyanobacterium RM1_1_27]
MIERAVLYKTLSLILLTTGILACGEAPTSVGQTSLLVEEVEAIDLNLPAPPPINAVCDYLFQTGDFDCDFNPLGLQQQCQNDYLSCPLYLTDREFPTGLGFIENLPELEGEVFTYGLPEAALRIGMRQVAAGANQRQVIRGREQIRTQLAVATSTLATVEILEFRVARRQGQTATVNSNESVILNGPTLRQQRCYEVLFIYSDPVGSQPYRITSCQTALA